MGTTPLENNQRKSNLPREWERLSLHASTDALTAWRIRTCQGWCVWHARQVARILQRAAAVLETGAALPGVSADFSVSITTAD
jgi:hypothetical protein